MRGVLVSLGPASIPKPGNRSNTEVQGPHESHTSHRNIQKRRLERRSNSTTFEAVTFELFFARGGVPQALIFQVYIFLMSMIFLFLCFFIILMILMILIWLIFRMVAAYMYIRNYSQHLAEYILKRNHLKKGRSSHYVTR